MVIVDEVSFLDYDRDLSRLSEYLQMYTQEQSFPFGTAPIVFLGDFRQLFPVNGTSIIEYPKSPLWGKAITTMVELKQPHQFCKCPAMTETMPELHSKGLSERHRKMLNSHVIDGNKVKMPELSKSRVAVYHNKLRSEHNSKVFKEYLRKYHDSATETLIPKSAIIIKSKVNWGGSTKKGQELSPTFRKILFEFCTDAHIKTSRSQRCSPLLTLIQGCPMMGMKNSDVSSGIANGTSATFEKVVFKQG